MCTIYVRVAALGATQNTLVGRTLSTPSFRCYHVTFKTLDAAVLYAVEVN